LKVNGNGHGPAPALSSAPLPKRVDGATPSLFNGSPEAAYSQFLHSISDRGREFLGILRDNPSGIDGNDLVDKLGFKSTSQIGGLTGGGLAKVANRIGLDLKLIYSTEATIIDGNRRLAFYPGKLLLSEKPAL
jgi:hypothetical protein